jgi:DNA-binding XRE family transcriptional regulator
MIALERLVKQFPVLLERKRTKERLSMNAVARELGCSRHTYYLIVKKKHVPKLPIFMAGVTWINDGKEMMCKL